MAITDRGWRMALEDDRDDLDDDDFDDDPEDLDDEDIDEPDEDDVEANLIALP